MMLRVAFLSGLLSSIFVVIPIQGAQAGCSWTKVEHIVSGAIRLEWHRQCDGASNEGELAPSVVTTPIETPPRDSGWDAICVRTALAIGKTPAVFCDEPFVSPVVPATQVPVMTPGMVEQAFRRIELPASDLVVQPPGGETLVNFDTNFYTEQGAFTRTVNLLGKRVELRIWPSRYDWVFGDGSSLASESAGAPYPDLLITHDYRAKGGVSPRVDTTYAARFRVDGGPWRDVDGTVTVAGQPVQLEVRTATPVLVGYH